MIGAVINPSQRLDTSWDLGNVSDARWAERACGRTPSHPQAPENTVVFNMNVAQIWISCLALNIGRPFRAPIWQNRTLVAVLVSCGTAGVRARLMDGAQLMCIRTVSFAHPSATGG